MDLHERIATALGWTLAETRSFSFHMLREIVKPVSPQLALELTKAIETGAYIYSDSYDY